MRKACVALVRVFVVFVVTLALGVAIPSPAYAGFDDLCSAGSITDKIDRTRKVYGGAWASCGGRGAEHVRLRVTLFRNGKPVRHHVVERFGAVTGVNASVRFRDLRRGKQRWRTKALVRWKPYGWWLTYKDVDWSNVYYH